MNHSSSQKYTEWFVASSLILILSFVILCAKIQVYRLSSLPEPLSTQVEITVGGHVAKPGAFIVQRGTPLSEVLIKARPLPFASLSEFDLTERMEKNFIYTIDKLNELTLYVEGACENEVLRVPPGFRLCDMKGLIKLHPNADLSILKKKRCVKDQEIIKIALKK